MVVGVDLEEIEPIEGVTTFQADITEKETLKLVRDALLGPADVVICDAAPNLTGIWDVDHTKSIELSRSALKMALELLRPGGNFLVKTFQGDMFIQFLNEVKRDFSRVQAHSPAASRKESAEMYIVAKGLLSAPIRPGDVHDVLISSTGKDGDGIVEIMGFAVIVKGSGLGESVRVKIETVKHNFAFAKIIERL
jgi:23S rRNA (uridine2552-2'-O)-methyltransferase